MKRVSGHLKTQPAKIAVIQVLEHLRERRSHQQRTCPTKITRPVYKKLRQARVQCALRRDKLLSEGKSLSLKEAEVLLSLVMVPNRESSNGEPGPNTGATQDT